MNLQFSSMISAFADLNVLLVGDCLLDSYWEGEAGRLSREAPVPIVNLIEKKDIPGGVGNTAVNIKKLGARLWLLSVLGNDGPGESLKQALETQGVSTDLLLYENNRQTVAKNRIVSNPQVLLRLDQGSSAPLDEVTEQKMTTRLEEYFPSCDAVVVSDYGYGTLTPKIIQSLAKLQSQTPRILAVDSRNHLSAFRDVGVTVVKPNYDEAAILLGLEHQSKCSWERVNNIAPHMERVLKMTGSQIVAVTLDTEGAIILEKGGLIYRTYAQPIRHACSAGAGDTFISVLTLSLAVGARLPAAADLASAASAIVVAKPRTATCSARELRETLSSEDKYIADPERLSARLELYRQRGKQIVFTNGCFDILHRGHITHLNRAKMLGDILVVGLNTDNGVRRLKGSGRPLNPLEDRIQILAALSGVDHIVPFDEDTACNLIQILQPDVFVKGGNHSREELPEVPLVEELGGEVQILPFFDDRSPESVVQRITSSHRS